MISAHPIGFFLLLVVLVFTMGAAFRAYGTWRLGDRVVAGLLLALGSLCVFVILWSLVAWTYGLVVLHW